MTLGLGLLHSLHARLERVIRGLTASSTGRTPRHRDLPDRGSTSSPVRQPVSAAKSDHPRRPFTPPQGQVRYRTNPGGLEAPALPLLLPVAFRQCARCVPISLSARLENSGEIINRNPLPTAVSIRPDRSSRPSLPVGVLTPLRIKAPNRAGCPKDLPSRTPVDLSLPSGADFQARAVGSSFQIRFVPFGSPIP